MDKRYIVGVLPQFDNFRLAIKHVELGTIKEYEGLQFTEAIKTINNRVKRISEAFIIVQRIDMLDKGVRQWAKIEEIIDDWKRYEDWKPRKTKRIPKQTKKEDIQAEYFRLLREHRDVNSRHQAEKMFSNLVSPKTDVIYTTVEVRKARDLVVGQTLENLQTIIDDSSRRPGSYPSLTNDNIYIVKRNTVNNE